MADCLHFFLLTLLLHLLSQYQSESEPRPPSCLEHHRQPLNMYCVQDRRLICGLCLTVGKHQGHPIDDLHAEFIREKQTPLQLLAKLFKSRGQKVGGGGGNGLPWQLQQVIVPGKQTITSCCVQVCELWEQLEREKARCEDLLRQDQLNVIQYFQKLEMVLARKKCACLAALKKAGADVCLAYDPLIEQVKELQVGVKSFLSSACALPKPLWAELDASVFHRKNRWTWCLLDPPWRPKNLRWSSWRRCIC